jgi:hypothetical protein
MGNFFLRRGERREGEKGIKQWRGGLFIALE